MSDSSEVVYLDVGGKKFKTTKTTLMMIPYFECMNRVNNGIRTTEDSPYFIDRDPKFFRHILNFARNNFSSISDNAEKYIEKHADELTFYGFECDALNEKKYRNIDCRDNEKNIFNIRENQHKNSMLSPFFEYVYGEQLTVHMRKYFKITHAFFHPEIHNFTSLPAKSEIHGIDLKRVYVVIDPCVPKKDLEQFYVTYGFVCNNEKYTWNLNLDMCAYNNNYHMSYEGHYIQIPLINATTTVLNNFSFTIEINTTTNKYKETIRTSIIYYTSEVCKKEINKFNYCNLERIIIIQESFDFDDTDNVIIPNGSIISILWKADDDLDYVNLFHSKQDHEEKTKITYNKGMYQFSEPKKHDLKPLKDNRGMISFNFDNITDTPQILHPYIYSVNQNTHIELPLKTSGRMWVTKYCLIKQKKIDYMPNEFEFIQ